METKQDNISSPSTKVHDQAHGSMQYKKYMTKDEVLQESQKKVYELPFSKRWPFTMAETVIPINASLSGLICSSYLRRMLMIRQGNIYAAVSMAFLPGLAVKLGWFALVDAPILSGDLQCAICGEMRGALVNTAFGVLYPLVLGVPFYSGLAKRYMTVQVPPLKQAYTDSAKYFDFWAKKFRYFKIQFIGLMIFQGLVGVMVAKAQMDVVQNEIKEKYVKVEVADS